MTLLIICHTILTILYYLNIIIEKASTYYINNDSLYNNLIKGLNLAYKVNDSKSIYIASLRLAQSYIKINNTEQSEKYLNKLEEHLYKSNYQHLRESFYFLAVKANLLLNQNNTNKAKEILLKIDSLFPKNNNLLILELKNHLELKMKSPILVKNFINYVNMRDSTDFYTKMKNSFTLSTIYELDIKEKEIQLATEINNNQKIRNKLLMLIIILIFIVAIFCIGIIVKRYKKNKDQLNKENSILTGDIEKTNICPCVN